MKNEIDVDKVIRDLGGPAKVAELCGIGTIQAISMWSARQKIPPARLMFLKLARPDVFAFEKLGADDTPQSQSLSGTPQSQSLSGTAPPTTHQEAA